MIKENFCRNIDSKRPHIDELEEDVNAPDRVNLTSGAREALNIQIRVLISIARKLLSLWSKTGQKPKSVSKNLLAERLLRWKELSEIELAESTNILYK